MKAKEREEGMEERKWGQITSAEEMDAFLDKKIRENRVHNFSFQLTDKEGKAQKGCRVQVIHQDHDFTFGVCPNGHISMTNKLACGEGKEAESYYGFLNEIIPRTRLELVRPCGQRILSPLCLPISPSGADDILHYHRKSLKILCHSFRSSYS